ncbi:hypothetical protein LPJ72_006123 [Coemansia sp. Benny D160-2]|nr:hypothetical protein LPJ72_006123 [Coemansia sp. Benny D160-2]
MSPYVVLVSFSDFSKSKFCDFVEVPIDGTYRQFKWAMCERLREAKVAFINAGELAFRTSAVSLDQLNDDANFHDLIQKHDVVEIESCYSAMGPIALSFVKGSIEKTCMDKAPAAETTSVDIPVALERENTLVESNAFSLNSAAKIFNNDISSSYATPDNVSSSDTHFANNAIYTC